MLIIPFIIIAMLAWSAVGPEDHLIVRVFFWALGAAVIAFGVILIRALLL